MEIGFYWGVGERLAEGKKNICLKCWVTLTLICEINRSINVSSDFILMESYSTTRLAMDIV